MIVGISNCHLTVYSKCYISISYQFSHRFRGIATMIMLISQLRKPQLDLRKVTQLIKRLHDLSKVTQLINSKSKTLSQAAQPRSPDTLLSCYLVLTYSFFSRLLVPPRSNICGGDSTKEILQGVQKVGIFCEPACSEEPCPPPVRRGALPNRASLSEEEGV